MQNSLIPTAMLLAAGVLWSFSGVLIKQIHWNAWAIAASRSLIGGMLQFVFLVLYCRASTKGTDRGSGDMQSAGAVNGGRKDASKDINGANESKAADTNGRPSLYFAVRQKLSEIYLIRDKAHWCGAICFVINMICLVTAFQLTKAANAVFLHFSGMVLVAIFSGPILNQKPTKQDWISVCAGLVGMLLISMDALDVNAMIGTALGIVCAVTLALTDICLGIRVQRNVSQVAALDTICLANTIMFVLGAPIIFQSCAAHALPNGSELAFLLVLGIVPWAVPDVLYAVAIKYVPILRALILALLDPVLTAVWPMLVLKEIPSITVILGASVAMIAVVYQTVYERSLIKKAV